MVRHQAQSTKEGGNFLVIQWLGLHVFTASLWRRFQSLVWELRSHKPLGAAKQKQNKYNKQTKNEGTTLKKTTIPSMQSVSVPPLPAVLLEAVPLRIQNAFDILPSLPSPTPTPTPNILPSGNSSL